MSLAEKLKTMGFDLPAVSKPAANYVPYLHTGNYVFISGQIPFLNGEPAHLGKIGDNLALEDGVEAAKACALNILAQINDAVSGDLSKIKQCIKLGGFVNCTPDFTQHPEVINGASDLIVEALGDKGKHTRFAVGTPALPRGVAVEIDALFELEN